MARIHAKSVAHYVDEFDFSGVSNSAALAFNSDAADVTAFADTDMTYVQGKTGFTWDISGMFSTASPNFDGEMFIDLTSASRRVGIYPGGDADGTFGYEGKTLITASPRLATVGGAALMNVSWRGEEPVVRSVILDTNTALAASGNGTEFQYGTIAATRTMVGILRLLSIGGSGNNTLDVKIQSDATGFGSPTDQLTFTQLNQGSGATHEVVTAAGPGGTDDFWRVSYTYAGAGTRTFSVVVAFGSRPT